MTHELAASVLAHGKRQQQLKKPEAPKPPKTGEKKLKEMHVRKAHNKGFIARHEFEPPIDIESKRHPDEEHILPDMAALHDHLDEHLGGGGGEPAESAEENENV